MEMLQGVWKQHLRPRAVVGYGAKIFLPSPPNYVTRSPGRDHSELILPKLKNTPTIILVSTDTSKIQPFKRHFDL